MQHPLDKATVLAAVIEELLRSFDITQSSSKKARAGGNDSESKAEGKYDTRSTEENYLADGLAKQALASLQAAEQFRKLAGQPPQTRVDLGALVQLEFQDGASWFLLGPAAGGLEVVCSGIAVTVITPESPLGSKIMCTQAGDRVPSPSAKVLAVS